MQQTFFSFWPRNAAICGGKNDVLAQVFSNRVAGNVLRRTMPMWMALVACGFRQRTVLVIYQHQESHMGRRKTTFQRLQEMRNRQQLFCAIYLRRHVGRFVFAAGILDHKICIARTQEMESDKAEQRHE